MTAVRTILDPIPRPDDTWVKLAYAAETLNLTKVTVRKMVSHGQLQAFRLPNGELRFREADVLALLTPVPNAYTHQVALATAVPIVAPVVADEVVVVEPVATNPEPVPLILTPVPADEAYPPGVQIPGRWPAKPRNDDVAPGTADHQGDDEVQATERGVL